MIGEQWNFKISRISPALELLKLGNYALVTIQKVRSLKGDGWDKPKPNAPYKMNISPILRMNKDEWLGTKT